MVKEEHLAFIKVHGDFKIDCSKKIFSNEELQSLKKYGHWFNALDTGALKPFTELQERFIEVAKGKETPFSLEEKVWFKYKGRKRIEKENHESLNAEFRFEEEFYSREDYYKIHPHKIRKI